VRTHPRTTLILPTALLALLTICAMAAASRAEAGEVHFDPESPAGKEYALPLQQARNEALGTGGGEAAPGAGGGDEAGAAAPLFGVGVGGKGGGSGPGGEGAGNSGGSSKTEGRGQSSVGGGSSPEGKRGSGGAGAAAASASYSDSQGLLLLAGILVLGAVGGLGLRAAVRQRPAT
jgi:hypothetical protein